MIQAYNLILEITRRCNMRCDHCMRGAVQRLDMSYGTMWNALKNIEHISTLTITGGEPSLRPQALRDLWNILLSRGIHVGSFYVVTNAKSTYKRLEFLEALDKLHQWCDEPDGCTLCVSQDQYHNSERLVNMKHYAGNYVSECGETYWVDREYFRPEQRTAPIEKVIDDGRAKELQLGSSKARIQEPWEVYRDSSGDLCIQDNEIYIAANGNVTSCCDMSYKRIDAECIGNVNEEPLEDIILRNCEWAGESDEEMQGESTPDNLELHLYK